MTERSRAFAQVTPARVGLVALGGAVGTTVRAALEVAWPTAAGGLPWTTLAINVVGSLLLGALLAAVRLRGPDAGRRRLLRLTLGTGLLGGFTTYSTFVLEVERLLEGGSVALGLAYAVGSVVLGVGAAVLGHRAATAVAGRRSR